MKIFLGRLELFLRHAVVYPVLRILLRNGSANLPIDIAAVRSILILRYDKLGDMIVTLPIFRMLKKRNPHLRIGVLTSRANLEILDGEQSVDERFVLYRNPVRLMRELQRMRHAHFDLVINFIFNRTTSGGLIANYVCPRGTKIGQGAESYRFYFNALVALPRATVHMFEILVFYIEQVFGFRIPEGERRLHIEIQPEARISVDQFLRVYRLRRRGNGAKDRSQYVVLNVSAREWNKRISDEQGTFLAGRLAAIPHLTTIVTAAPEDAMLKQRIVRETNSLRCIAFPAEGNATMQEMASLIEGAVCVVTPDTSIIHVASSTGTPVLGLFSPLQVNQEWLPYKVKDHTVIAPPGRPVSGIPMDNLEAAVKRFVRPLGRNVSGADRE